MATTANLAVIKIDTAQAQKEVTANEAFDVFDAALSELAKALPDANYTLLATTVPKEWQYGIIKFTGALTAARNVIVPTNKKEYTIVNATTGGFAVTVKTSAGTGIAVTPGATAILRCDGTNVVGVTSGSGAGTVTSVDGSGGVQAIGGPITGSGTLRAAGLVNAQIGITYTFADDDRAKLVTTGNAAAIAATLPQAGAASAFLAGWFVDVQNRGAGTLTITPTTSTIDGAATLAVPTGQGVRLFSDGTNYFTQRGMDTAAVAQPFDVSTFFPGIPTASAIVLRVPVARAVNFAANFAASQGRASAAATASTTFDVQKNGVSIGTIVFAAAASTATFTTAAGAAQSLAAGDVLSIVAPATPDTTLANPGFALAGTR